MLKKMKYWKQKCVGYNFIGWLFGLSTEVPEKPLTNDLNDLNYGFSIEEKQKILKLKWVQNNDFILTHIISEITKNHFRFEIEELEQKLSKDREKYLMLTQGDSENISRLPNLIINQKVTAPFLTVLKNLVFILCGFKLLYNIL